MSTAVMEKTASRPSFKTGSREYFITRRMLQKQIWPRIGYSPHPKQQEVHNAAMRGARFIMCVWGRRAGKSEMVAAEHLIEMAYPPPGQLPLRIADIVAPEADITDKIFRYLWHWIVVNRTFDVEPTDASKRERYIQMPWSARLEGKTADDPRSLLGDGIVQRASDESARYKSGKNLAFEFLHPPLVDSLGRIFDTTTPQGLNDAYEQYQDWTAAMRSGDPLYFTSHATSYDNPHLPAGEIDRIKQYCERNGMENYFRQEYLAEFVTFSGSVYPQFGERHIAEVPLIRDLPFDLAIDHGFQNPAVCLFCQITPDERVIIHRELYKSGLTADEFAQAIKAELTALGNPEVRNVWADPAGAQANETLRQHGLPVRSGSELTRRLNAVIDGIVSVQILFNRTDIAAVLVNPLCVNFIKEHRLYRWSDKTQKDAPVKVLDHTCDAFRYLIMGEFGDLRNWAAIEANWDCLQREVTA